jgi:hypothetical protein
MLIALSTAVLVGKEAPEAFLPTRCIGSPTSDDSQACSRSKPSLVAISAAESEQALTAFAKLYVGPAHGIDNAELESVEGGGQRIVAFVYDWNGILNIPSNFQGLPVSFTQYVPVAGTWQL